MLEVDAFITKPLKLGCGPTGVALIVLVSNFEDYFTFFIMTKVCYVLEDIIDLIVMLVPIELMKKIFLVL